MLLLHFVHMLSMAKKLASPINILLYITHIYKYNFYTKIENIPVCMILHIERHTLLNVML